MRYWNRICLMVIALCALQTVQAAGLLEGYQAITTSLKQSASALGVNPRASVTRLEEARDRYRRISSEIRAQKLIPAGAKAFDNARTAISRGSLTDLEAQSSQIERIIERALYEELFFAMSAKQPSAIKYAGVLARAFELPTAQQLDLKASVQKRQDNRVRALLETGIANLMQRSLQNAQRNANNQIASFSSTVRAASAFLIVQDSPRVGALSVERYSEVLGLLANGDTGGFRVGVKGLLQQVTSFGAKARALLKSSVAKPKPAAKPKPSVKPSTKPAPSKPQTAKPSTLAMAKPTTPVMSKPVVKPVAVPTATITRELVSAGINPAKAERFARDLAEQGYSSFSKLLDAISLQLASALIDVQNARIDSGRESISSAKNLFNQGVSPIVKEADPGLAARASNLFAATEAASGVRPVDISTLLSEVDVVRQWSRQQPMSAMQGVVSTAQSWWMGGGALGSFGLRGIIFLLVALAFIYPIYLLRLAFGGRNPYWNYIGIAMLLLFIPPLLEGISWVGSLIAQSTEIVPVKNFFNGLTSLSVLQNPLAQMIWALMLIVTVIFATIGFRGIAAQFGLIRTRTPLTNEPASVKSTSSQQIRNPTNPTNPNSSAGRTIVEWDEEF